MIALTIVTRINQYFLSFAIRARDAATHGETQEGNDVTEGERLHILRLNRLIGALWTYNIVAWVGFAATASATFQALLSLAWDRDLLGTHHGRLLSVVLLLVAGSSLPIGALVESQLSTRAAEAEVSLSDLRGRVRASMQPPAAETDRQ